MEEALIRVKDLCKIYNPGENEVRALDHINLEINKGEFVAIIGQSGSGKSTFMNMLGCLDVPTSGEYFLNGTDVSTMCVIQLVSDIIKDVVKLFFRSPGQAIVIFTVHTFPSILPSPSGHRLCVLPPHHPVPPE